MQLATFKLPSSSSLPLSDQLTFLSSAILQSKMALQYSLKKLFQQFQNLFASTLYMNNLLPELQQYKERIPEFILKLYHILEKKEHEQYLTWFGDDEVCIKHPKKFQQKVLPKYFRHKHLSSFIRQLNMYKFSKVPKILKQKNHMYFKNENFQRGQIQKLLKIKRNTKKNRGTEETLIPERVQECSNSQNVSINQKLHQNQKQVKELQDYKEFVKKSAAKIKQIISKVSNSSSNGQIQTQLKPIAFICQQLMECKRDSIQSLGLSSSHRSMQLINLLNYSQIALPKIEADLIFPSQCSLYNFNNLHNN